MENPRVVISNVYDDENRGGAAITAATIRATKGAWPSSEITLIGIDTNKRSISRAFRHTLKAFPEVTVLPAPLDIAEDAKGGQSALAKSILHRSLKRAGEDPALRAIERAHIVMGKGGQLLGRSPYKLRKAMSLWMGTYPISFAQKLGKPTSFYSVTIGPFKKHDPGRAIIRSFLRRTTLVLPRDQVSALTASSLGIHEDRIKLIPDSVFRYGRPTDEHIAAVVESLGLQRGEFIAITARKFMRDTLWGRKFTDKLLRVIETLVEDGRVKTIAVVVQATGDRHASLDLAERLPRGTSTVIDADLCPEDLIALYGGAALLIGGRVHSAIFATVAGTPAIPIDQASTKKARDIFSQVGLDQWVVDGVHAERGEIANSMEHILDHLDEARRIVREAHDRARNTIVSHDAVLRSLVP